MPQVLRLLRKLPVAEKLQDIAIFINRELLPFLQELRESTASTFEQVTTNRLLGRDTPGTGDVEEISLDDTLEFTGSGSIQRAAITGDATIPAGSNVSTVPALTGILSDIAALEAAEYITYASNVSLTNERVATTSDTIEVDIGTSGQALWNVKQANSHVVALSVTQNAMAFPVGFVNGDTFDATTAAGNVALNGIDSTGINPGFEFILRIGTSSGNVINVNNENASALAANRINTPNSVTQVLGEDCGFLIRRATTRWLVIDNPPAASTSITYSGQQLQRAALTGFTAALANSNATTSAEPIVTYSASSNMSAERVLSNGTNTTINTSVANQISVDAPTPTWATVLAAGNTTGATNPTISSGQYIQFLGATPGGDLRSSGLFNLRSADTIDIEASAGNCGLNAAVGNLNLSGVNTLFTASTGFIQFTVLGVPRFYFTNTGALAIGAGADRGTAGELFISQGDTTPIWGQATTASYTDASVTLPKLATQPTDTLVANITAGTASPIAVGFADIDSTSITWDAVTHTFQRAALTGDVTAPANSNATTIANNAVTTVKILDNNVTLAKIETLAARTLISNNTLATATATEVPHTDIIIRPDLLDCFVGGVASTTLPMSALGWMFRDITGTGTIIRNGSSGSDGIYRIGTGAVANDASSLSLGDSATSQILTPTQFKYTEFRIDLQASTSSRIQIGFMQNTGLTTGGTAACVFIFDTIESANWQTLTRQSSTNTTKVSGTVVNTSPTTLGIATDFSGPTIRFYVNDTLVATHTSAENIPTTDMNVGIRIQTYTGATRTIDISRFTAIRRLDGRSIPEV